MSCPASVSLSLSLSLSLSPFLSLLSSFAGDLGQLLSRSGSGLRCRGGSSRLWGLQVAGLFFQVVGLTSCRVVFSKGPSYITQAPLRLWYLLRRDSLDGLGAVVLGFRVWRVHVSQVRRKGTLIELMIVCADFHSETNHR